MATAALTAADVTALLAQARGGPEDVKLRVLSEVTTVVTKRQRALLPTFFADVVEFLVGGSWPHPRSPLPILLSASPPATTRACYSCSENLDLACEREFVGSRATVWGLGGGGNRQSCSWLTHW
jgi:hypothetical protein